MAATGARQQQQPQAAAAEPKFELAEKAGSYVLRITLQGLRKDDFRVQVDRAGRLTVRGATRPGSSLHKVFQLPADASLDDIAGRFQAGVLTLTVPKRVPSTSVEEVKKSTPGVAKEEDAAKTTQSAEVDAAKSMPAKPTPPAEVDGAKKMGKEEGAAKPTPPAEVDGAKKMSKGSGAGKKETDGAKQPAGRDDGGEKKETAVGTKPKESTFGRTTRQVAEHVQRMEEDSRRKEIEHKPAPAAKKEQEPKPKAPQAAATPEKPAPKPTSGEVGKESLAETVRQHGEEERAKAAAAATVMEAKAERAKKAVASTCAAWKERIAGELKGVTDMKWADDAVEMARKNKEVIAVGVAAFSIGFLVSQKLFRK
ncbi:neurofilament heavy polypeptide-like [Hordeum vulgare subsp. vulgare]|uniref:neurofilament heavy polypeptide-like n=1 Tax=Hordeum vulgare subsp. vulgare TaxID=112509 RepID=UPI0002955704|nr:neurofilament heavy polypeptide-like [Hordeum vulgare subsp. vulgare]